MDTDSQKKNGERVLEISLKVKKKKNTRVLKAKHRDNHADEKKGKETVGGHHLQSIVCF